MIHANSEEPCSWFGNPLVQDTGHIMIPVNHRLEQQSTQTSFLHCHLCCADSCLPPLPAPGSNPSAQPSALHWFLELLHLPCVCWEVSVLDSLFHLGGWFPKARGSDNCFLTNRRRSKEQHKQSDRKHGEKEWEERSAGLLVKGRKAAVNCAYSCIWNICWYPTETCRNSFYASGVLFLLNVDLHYQALGALILERHCEQLVS